MALRETLRSSNGLPDIGQYTVEGAGSDIAKAADIFRTHGFVIIRNALSHRQVRRLLAACEEEAAAITMLDPLRVGSRGEGRYSFGAAQKTGHLLHRDEWAELSDLDAVTPVLHEIFGHEGYVCAGAGGDFVLGGVETYQNLHLDINAPDCYRRSDAPVVTVNVTVRPLTWENGPMRIVPGTHLPLDGVAPEMWQPLPEDVESQQWKLSTLSPLPAGCAIVRDNRTWHGGTPNLSTAPRFLPNCEFAARWWCTGRTSSLQRNNWFLGTPCMPQPIFAGLTFRGRVLCKLVVADGPVDVGVREDFGCEYVPLELLRQARSAQWRAENGFSPVPEDAARQDDGERPRRGKPEAVYFGLHNDWCDHVIFSVDGTFKRGRRTFEHPLGGHWYLQESDDGALLRLDWEDDASECFASRDAGRTFSPCLSQGTRKMIALSRCGESSLGGMSIDVLDDVQVERHSERWSCDSRTAVVAPSCGASPRSGALGPGCFIRLAVAGIGLAVGLCASSSRRTARPPIFRCMSTQRPSAGARRERPTLVKGHHVVRRAFISAVPRSSVACGVFG
mmetsp:Transcript_21632/g.60370  ORF Transcript_21632/g.60370 Transcript_21632/m.60370 type:complete len:561 (-) Transcript_21632:59-1741(-)